LGFLLFGLFLCAAPARGQSVSLAWNPDTSGAAIGYYLYFGTNSAALSSRIDVGTNILATISGLAVGKTYYFVVTAYDSARVESPPSNETSFVVPTTPSVLTPQLAAVTPSSATPGANVCVYGANFSTTASVQFAGVNAPFTVSSDGFLIATVPAGAASGPLSITTSHGVVSLQFVVLPATPPANDNFANAQILSGVTAIVATNTFGATKQPGEPNHAGNAGGSSVWYRWTAPSAGTWFLDTTGSTFTTLLAVYTGNALTGLSTVANNLGAGGVLTNTISFTAVAGVTYQIAADGFGGAAGSLVLRLAPAPAPSTTVYSTTFEAANGFYTSQTLAGQAGWVSHGTASSGLKLNSFLGYGQQGFIGFGSTTPASSTLLYFPLNYTVNTNSSPLIQFSVMMQVDALVASSYNDTFGWVVRNASGHEFFRISFDDYTKTVNYSLDNGTGPVFQGLTFNSSAVYNLAITMDFSLNTWSATLSGLPIATGQPITTTGSALTLGDIDASEVFRVASQPGTDGMLFDNYLVTAGPSLAPAIVQGPANQILSAGNNAFFGALASGAPPLSYQWYANSLPVPNATNSSLFLTGVNGSEAGNYSLQVTNPYGTASTAATLTVTTPPPKSLFAAPVAIGSGGALLSLNVAVGNNYEFQSSTNLHDWVTLGSFLAMSTNALCFDPAASTSAGAPSRFYRLVSP
jgi:hypothetical protein